MLSSLVGGVTAFAETKANPTSDVSITYNFAPTLSMTVAEPNKTVELDSSDTSLPEVVVGVITKANVPSKLTITRAGVFGSDGVTELENLNNELFYITARLTGNYSNSLILREGTSSVETNLSQNEGITSLEMSNQTPLSKLPIGRTTFKFDLVFSPQ